MEDDLKKEDDNQMFKISNRGDRGPQSPGAFIYFEEYDGLL
jgi:hypothetical protein